MAQSDAEPMVLRAIQDQIAQLKAEILEVKLTLNGNTFIGFPGLLRSVDAISKRVDVIHDSLEILKSAQRDATTVFQKLEALEKDIAGLNGLIDALDGTAHDPKSKVRESMLFYGLVFVGIIVTLNFCAILYFTYANLNFR